MVSPKFVLPTNHTYYLIHKHNFYYFVLLIIKLQYNIKSQVCGDDEAYEFNMSSGIWVICLLFVLKRLLVHLRNQMTVKTLKHLMKSLLKTTGLALLQAYHSCNF